MLNPTLSLSCLIFSLHVIVIQSQTNTSNDRLCSPFNCGRINFPFPFSDQSTFGSSGPVDSGFPGYQIICDDPSRGPKFMLSGELYQVKDVFVNADSCQSSHKSSGNSTNLITLVNTELIRDFNLSTGSCQSLHNLTVPVSAIPSNPSLELPPWTTNLTFFKCPSHLELPSQGFLDQIAFNYSCGDEPYRLYLWRSVFTSNVIGLQPIERKFDYSMTPRGCDLVMVPVSSVDMRLMFINDTSVANGYIEPNQLTKALDAGFPLQWNCSVECDNCKKINRGCGFDGISVVCICDGGSSVGASNSKSKVQTIILGVACGIFSIIALVSLLVYKNRASLICNTYLKKSTTQTTSDGTNAKDFIRTYRSHLLSNHSYNDIKKMTNGFKDKLGEGGYGDVYKGKLFDGRIVAVKLLKSADIISDDFITEVATIGRIHHFNVINLLGFCWDGSKQALIYEYMSNGSLADLLSKKEVENNHSLGVAKLIEIAIGVAEGIEYLHNGCESRILHLDIKPQNVLLDQSLNPKISDFGLAKVYSRDHSNVTMTTARGTIGYIAPEIFMGNLGNPSHKSDVYSYGMLLLEMVGGKQRFEQITSYSTGSSSTEAYFPEWMHEKLLMEADNDIVVDEGSVERKMTMVGLWCIQMKQRDRPSMKRVVEMLTGQMEDIEMPPKPLFMFSRPRQHVLDDQINSLGSDSSAFTLIHDQSLGMHN